MKLKSSNEVERQRSARPGWAAALVAACLLLGVMAGCRRQNAVPQPGTERYDAFVSAFYTGLAGLQVGDDVRAETALAESVVLGSGEPATWVNWGVLALRQRSYDLAADRLTHAHTLAPGNDRIDYLLGLMESERGNSAAAIGHLQQAVSANPRNVRALYQLASEVERQGDKGSDVHYEQLLRQILAVEPDNAAAQLDLGRVAAKLGDGPTLQAAVRALAAQSGSWPADVREQLVQLEAVASGPQPRAAATRTLFLRNVLMRVPAYRNALGDLRPAPGEGAQPMLRFLRAQNVPARPAAADMSLHLAEQPLNAGSGWKWSGALLLNGEESPVVAEGDGTHVRLANGADLPFPGAAGSALQPESVLPIDFNYDFKTDLVFAGPGGLRFYRQNDPARYTDVSAATKLPATVLKGAYRGAWALDVEADGDLDILLGATHGNPVLLRNNGDGTFAVQDPFPGVDGVAQTVWADLNGDGNPDAVLLDSAGRVHLFLNRRSGSFEAAKLPADLQPVKAIAVADLTSSDALQLVALTADGRVVRLASADEGQSWTAVDVLRVPDAAHNLSGEVRLYAEDLDNNGAVDLVLSTVSDHAVVPLVWLQGGQGSFELLPQQGVPLRTFGVADVQGDGHLALLGLADDGSVVEARTQSVKNYHWQTIRPRAKQATGDQRINSFGVGGEIEIRAGLLTQKQPIRSPALHFGLGQQTRTDVARILWPNGSVRAEFNLKANQQVLTEQRLKGSCPFLFAWNGHAMQFVKDSVPWGSAIGLRISALGSARIAATEEWYRIGRDQLLPHDGFYDLRVTGELWETYYYDALGLMTVDHPAGTEVFTDERYDVPAVKLAVTLVAEPQPVAQAFDDNGHDVSATVRALDGVYLDNFGRGQYQGITRDHYVEVALPETASTDRPLWLIAKGWLHPSDSSINIAVSQNSAEKPHWLRMEVPDGKGSWRVAKPNLGFPAGRNKICLFDLSGVFRPGEPHRLRLRTNLEVFWDQIQWAQGLPATPMRIRRLTPERADLHYRGFSVIQQANASSPEIPQYGRLASTTALWRDLPGFYTRFGDVRELLNQADDRYVIMNAGDEMSLRFAVPPPPPSGWVRDFVIAGDGWIKDGDYNSSYSQTVLPYPHHARRDYDTAPTRLEDDWEYRHHSQDWQTYHTRFVTPRAFLGALRSGGDE